MVLPAYGAVRSSLSGSAGVACARRGTHRAAQTVPPAQGTARRPFSDSGGVARYAPPAERGATRAGGVLFVVDDRLVRAIVV